MKKQTMVFFCFMLFCHIPVSAEDRIDLDGTSITGNRELPKVLYIVPWKKNVAVDLKGKPRQSLVDEALSPVDRDVFRRQIDYYGMRKQTGAAR